MNQARRYTYLTLYGLLLMSCSETSLTSKGMIDYVQSKDNGLAKEVNVDGWAYKIQYKPAEYILAIEQLQEPDAINKRTKQLENAAWFNVEVSREDKGIAPLRYNITSIEEYNSRYDYMLNYAAGDFTLIYNHSDTFKPISYHFETTYNLSPTETMIIGFSLPKNIRAANNDMQVVFRDRVFSGSIIKTIFEESDLSKIPKLINQ